MNARSFLCGVAGAIGFWLCGLASAPRAAEPADGWRTVCQGQHRDASGTGLDFEVRAKEAGR